MTVVDIDFSENEEEKVTGVIQDEDTSNVQNARSELGNFVFGYFILFCLFFAMFALCFVFGLREWLRPKDDNPIPVDREYVRDEFFLGASFRKKMNDWLKESTPLPSTDIVGQAGERVLQKKNGEKILVITGGNWLGRNSCEDLVYSQGNLHLPESTTLHREVYSLGSVHTDDDVHLQSLAGDCNIVLGARNIVARWIDALGSVHLCSGTVVQSRVTSREEILLEPGASARVLSSPLILTVRTDETKRQSFSSIDARTNICTFLDHPKQNSNLGDPITIGGCTVQYMDSHTWLIPGNVYLPTGYSVPKNIVVKGVLRSAQNCCFHGSVKAGEIHLGGENYVAGNLVSAGSLDIGEDARIAGSVAAENDVRIACASRIGTLDKPAAVSAGGSILLQQNVSVHGKLCAGEFVIAE